MLILKSLHLENFMLHRDTVFDLDSRSIFVEGRNYDSGMDSNGAGKSQLAEALIWNLFDTTTRGYDNVNEVVGPAGKGVSVTSVWYDESEKSEYQIIRTRNVPATGVSVFKDGQDISLRTSTMTQGLIDRWLGMGLSVFKNTVLSVQKDLDRFLDMDPEDRKKFMIQALGLDLLIEGARLVGQDLKDRRRTLGTLETDKRIAEADVTRAQEEQDGAEVDVAALAQTASTTRDQLGDEIAVLEAQATDLGAKSDADAGVLAVNLISQESAMCAIPLGLEPTIKDIESKYQIIGSQIGQDQGILRSSESQIARLKGQQIPDPEPGVDLEARLAIVDTEINKLAERGPDPVIALDLEISNLSKKLSATRGQVSANDVQINGLKNESSRLSGLSGRCPICKQPISPENVKDCTEEIALQIADLVTQKKKAEESALDLDSQYNTLIVQRSKLLADRQTRNRERERLTGEVYTLKARIQDRKNQVDIGTQILKLETDVLSANVRIELNTKKSKLLRTQIEGLRNQLSNRQAHEFEIRRLKTEIQGIFSSAQKQAAVWDAQIKAKEQQIWSLDNQEQDMEDRLDTARERYSQAAEKLLSVEEHYDKLTDEMTPLVYWERQFGTDLQIQILELVCQAIQDQANEYLLKLDCGLRFEFDIRVARGKEKLFILTCDSLGKTMAPRGRSGGEQSRLKVAVDLAMKSLSAERINLTWLDETLDGLDGSGISTVLDSVRDFAAGGRNIVCVSHNPKCRGFFGRVVTVERRNNESRIVS